MRQEKMLYEYDRMLQNVVGSIVVCWVISQNAMPDERNKIGEKKLRLVRLNG